MWATLIRPAPTPPRLHSHKTAVVLIWRSLKLTANPSAAAGGSEGGAIGEERTHLFLRILRLFTCPAFRAVHPSVCSSWVGLWSDCSEEGKKTFLSSNGAVADYGCRRGRRGCRVYSSLQGARVCFSLFYSAGWKCLGGPKATFSSSCAAFR